MVQWCGDRWRLIFKLGSRLALYSILIPFLLATFAMHRVKILPDRADSLLETMDFQDVTFPSRGERPVALRGWFFPHKRPEGTILVCHGVGANRGDLRHIIWLLHDARFQILAFDFRGHGESDGHTVTYGYAESDDVLGAYDYLLARNDVAQDRVFALGVSMGGASLLLALPRTPAVRAAVVDSAFGELESIVRHQFRWFPDPAITPLARATEFFGWIETGVNVRDVSPLRALGQIDIPLFFLHGSDDKTIPVAETRKLFAAYAGQKRLHIEEGVSHVGTVASDPMRYQREVTEFLLDSMH